MSGAKKAGLAHSAPKPKPTKRESAVVNSIARVIHSSIGIFFIALTTALACQPPCPVRAQDAGEMSSLKLVPIDADIYIATFRMREQWEKFVSGPVVQELLESSGVENALEQFRSEWTERDGIGSNVRIFWENGNTQDVMAFLGELFSSEMFVYGDEGVSKWYFADAKIKDEMRNLYSTGESPIKQLRTFTDTYLKLAGELNVPTLVMGARCQSEDIALGKIDQLEAALFGVGATDAGALIIKKLDRIDDARGNRLQLRLDGTQIPWDEIPTGEGFDDEMKDRVREVVEKKSMTITIGLLDGFFIAAISPTSKAILELGKGKSILEHPELQPVRDAAALPITSVSFMSGAMNQSLYESFQKNALSRSLSSNLGPLMQPLEVDSEVRDFYKELQGDCEWIDASLAKRMPAYKSSTSLSYWTPEGWERHVYSKTDNVDLDSSAPLGILEHLGKEPMMFFVARGQNRSENLGVMRQILQKLRARFIEAQELDWNELGWDFSDSNSLLNELEPVVKRLFPNMDWSKIKNALEYENVKEYIGIAEPSLVKLVEALESKLLPAMSGEQAMVVSGGDLKAKQWYKGMPPSVDPLAIPEIAFAFGVRDGKLLQDGIDDVFKGFDEMVEAMRAKNPSAIPAGYKIPRPAHSETAVGRKLWYEIPADCPVPQELMPHVFFARDYGIASYSDQQSMSMASATKLSVMPGVIDASANQSSVTYINIGKVFNLARPWIRYALIEGMESLEDSLIEETDAYQVFGDNYDLTGKDLLSAWTVLCKFGEFSAVSKSLPSGGSYVRSVYKSQK